MLSGQSIRNVGSFLIPQNYSLGLENFPESNKRLHLFRVPVGSL